MGRTTLTTRPDLVEGARAMMRKMSAEDISLVQRGMAERPDSVADLKTINVPTLIVIGEEDILSTPADGELMRQQYRRQSVQGDSESRALFALGAARGSCARAASVRWIRRHRDNECSSVTARSVRLC